MQTRCRSMENIRVYGMSQYVVYTKSGCGYCDKVKTLLKDVMPSPQIILCDIRLKTEESKDAFLVEMMSKIGWLHKTFPMVFLNGRFVGGYAETLKLYERSRLLDLVDNDF